MRRNGPSRRALLTAAPAAAVLSAGPQAFGAAADGLRVEDLRAEWLASPAAIDTRRPRFTWKLAETGERRRGRAQAAWRLVIASSAEKAGTGHGDVWDSGRRAGAQPRFTAEADLPLVSQQVYFWSVQAFARNGAASAWAKPARLLTGLLDAGDWRARWIAAEPDRPAVIAESRKGADVAPKPSPMFRKRFQLGRPAVRAVVSVCGLGQYVLTVNGRPVTDAVLNPGWTDYRRTVLYNSYEVGDLLRPGENVLGVRLGNGMYNQENAPGRYRKFAGTFGPPKLVLQLRIQHPDGPPTVVVSDEGWSRGEGGVRFSSIYGGEDFDARLEPPGWDRPGADPQGWAPALPVEGPGGVLKAQGVVPVRVDRMLAPVAVTEPRPGVFVYDFGLNAAAQPRLTVRGPAGAQVKLSPSEVLGPDGLIAPRSIGARPGLPVYYAYTLAGGGEESWGAAFTYCGSRYLQVEGASPPGRGGAVEIVRLENAFIHADAPSGGQFDSSERQLVAIHQLIRQAVLSNTVSVFTDCPHREKLGWLEQDQLNAATLLYNEDAITVFEKTIADIADAQLPSGQIPEIAPEYVQFTGPDAIYRDSPEWGGALVLAAWAAYRFYGDPRILEVGYPAMRRYADYLESRRVDGLLSYGLGDWLDIGPARGGVSQLTTIGLTATATYYEMLTALVQIAGVLGRPAVEAEDWRRRAAEVKTAFNRRFFDPASGRYDTGSQTAQAMSLALGLVPEGSEAEVLGRLVADIRGRSDHVTAGDVGFHYVVHALMGARRGDVLHAMLMRTDPPSYGAQLAAGATALTENWDPARGGSQNHFMLGHAEEWLFAGLAGLQVDFARRDLPFRIAPQPVEGVASAQATYRSVLGDVRSAWRRTPGGLELDVETPVGALAEVRIPAPLAAIRESGRPAPRSPGVLESRETGGEAIFTVASGRYLFTT